MILDFSQFSVEEILESQLKEFSEFPFILDFLVLWKEKKSIEVQTSGSTGLPKKLTFPIQSFIESAEMTGKFLDLKAGNTALLCLPMQYIAAKMMLARAIVLQLKLICIIPNSIISINETIDFAAMTPMQAEKSISKLSFIKKIILGGMPVAYKLEQKLKHIPVQIFETFGMTETLSHIAMRNISANEKQFKTLENITISLSEKNTLCVNIPFIKEKITTNDIVEVIDNNHFIWKGRVDNIINSGGIKIIPEEIEQKLKPFINEEFYITSEKDELLGEKVVLIIESTAILENIKQLFTQAKLLPYQTPKNIYLEEHLQRTESGKIKRLKR